MVQLTGALCKFMPWYMRNTSKVMSQYFRKQALRKQTQFLWGRSRNCPKLMVNRFQNFMGKQHTWAMKEREFEMDLLKQRTLAAAEEHGMEYWKFRNMLNILDIKLGPQSLAELAICEPRTFKCLVDICKAKYAENARDEPSREMPVPEHVYTRGRL